MRKTRKPTHQQQADAAKDLIAVAVNDLRRLSSEAYDEHESHVEAARMHADKAAENLAASQSYLHTAEGVEEMLWEQPKNKNI